MLLFEFDNPEQVKQEILQTINSIDPSVQDSQLAAANSKLLDQIYTILNKGNVVDRITGALPDILKGEYPEQEIMRIAGAIADAPLGYKDKIEFAKNLNANKVINAKILVTPGSYTIDQLTMNNVTNKIVFDHLKNYGVGKQMKGPAEHALAILSKDVSIQGKGDVTVNGVAVEVKAATSEKRGGGGGRFGETGRIPSRQSILDLLLKFPSIAQPVQDFLTKQKSMNVETFVSLVNSTEIQPEERKQLADNLFLTIFGNEGKIVADEFAKPNANPDSVRRAYIASNFNWYKNSDMGGEWEVLVGMSFADNAVGVMKTAEDINKITVYKKNPAIVTTDKPQEMLFQFNPKP